jgi:Ni/Fe-hydrogenase subunit HybB-like protein
MTTLGRNAWLAIVALLMELGALVVLVVPEERTSQGASVWSWYWPLANTLYFVGLIAGAIAIAWAVVSLAASMSKAGNRSSSLIALGLGALAIVVNRLVPYH